MTDADLIAALGWKPCRSFGGSGPCDEHGYAQRLNPSGVCSYQAARLHLVRAGIDLARERIAQAMRSNSRPADPALSPLMRLMTVPSERPVSWEQVARIVREWQP